MKKFNNENSSLDNTHIQTYAEYLGLSKKEIERLGIKLYHGIRFDDYYLDESNKKRKTFIIDDLINYQKYALDKYIENPDFSFTMYGWDK